MMRKLEVPFIPLYGKPAPAEVSRLLDRLQVIPISCNPWPQYAHAVEAAFSIAHSEDAILLKYYVKESHLLAAASTNGDIHKDSCVEFFVACDDGGNYYNLEFNCIGWCKAGFGSSRENRAPLPVTATDLITTATHIISAVEHGRRSFVWELTVIIPAVVFSYHNITTLTAMKVKGNFYKCGDEMPAPHFLTWNDVKAAMPDFHRREDFADICFL
ncbi:MULTISPECIES: carbohydrate-binding family 9-like protein [Chitinophaga]|uniref:carbohydrate-binding family 9-like protein n=1 Tax=Chitinophaga TaxID=79328 RepID=UPI00300FF8D9